MQDLIIKNAMLYDGTGAAPRLEQVAVKDGMIAAMGADCGAAREVIDANGLALMPGIIDSHTHYDAQITWDPLASPSPAMGVTTVVIGNCGFTIAPCRPQDRDINLRNLTHVEGMSLDALRAGVDWSFETFPEFLKQLEQKVSDQTSPPSSGIHRFAPGCWARTPRSVRQRQRKSRRCAASCWMVCKRARSDFPRRRPISTTARTAFRCRRAWLINTKWKPWSAR